MEAAADVVRDDLRVLICEPYSMTVWVSDDGGRALVTRAVPAWEHHSEEWERYRLEHAMTKVSTEIVDTAVQEFWVTNE